MIYLLYDIALPAMIYACGILETDRISCLRCKYIILRSPYIIDGHNIYETALKEKSFVLHTLIFAHPGFVRSSVSPQGTPPGKALLCKSQQRSPDLGSDNATAHS